MNLNGPPIYRGALCSVNPLAAAASAFCCLVDREIQSSLPFWKDNSRRLSHSGRRTDPKADPLPHHTTSTPIVFLGIVIISNAQGNLYTLWTGLGFNFCIGYRRFLHAESDATNESDPKGCEEFQDEGWREMQNQTQRDWTVFREQEFVKSNVWGEINTEELCKNGDTKDREILNRFLGRNSVRGTCKLQLWICSQNINISPDGRRINQETKSPSRTTVNKQKFLTRLVIRLNWPELQEKVVEVLIAYYGSK